MSPLVAARGGFDVADDEINPLLKHHQRVIVRWAIRGGQRAIFAAFGLGKTPIQIEILRIVQARCGGRALIVLPLGVRQEFRRDGRLEGEAWEREAAALGLDIVAVRERFAIDFVFIRTAEEMHKGRCFYLTNYESIRDGRLDPNLFDVVSLDEASVLRSFGSKTYQTFLGLFSSVRYRFVATATPSPNRFKELIHYAGFLGVMDTGQALTRFFQRDSSKANNLTLYPHKEDEFWLWVASWAVFVQRPSDVGGDDTGYELPPLSVVWHAVASPAASPRVERDGQMMLVPDTARSLVDAAREKRETLPARVARMVDILAASPTDHFIIWHDLEVEREAIERALPGVVSVYGAQDLDEREQAIIDFSDGRFRLLAAKPVIAGSGCNFQRHCHKAVFLGVGFKFNDFIQAIHRIQRFMQARPVEIHVIHAETERDVVRVLQRKWTQHEEMVAKMTEIIRKYGLDRAAIEDVLNRTIGVERVLVEGQMFRVANNDAVDEARRQPEASVGLIVTSIPFSNHYEYTPAYEDFGHTDDNAHFWAQMDYLTPELFRILAPGRLACIHVKDRILFGSVTGAGAPTVSPFHAEAIMHYRKHGFDFMGMITVVTDVVRENNQTYRLGYTEMCKDGSKMGVGSPEYVVLVRKPQSDRTKGYADDRVVKTKNGYSLARWQVDAHAFWRSSGDRLPTADELAALGPGVLAKAFTEASAARVYDYAFHIEVGERLQAADALPSTFMSLAPAAHGPWVWHDVDRLRTLNAVQSARNVEKHICPLQFDIVDRLIERWSNPGDVVYDPFGGLMTVPVRAIRLGRQGRASELSRGYFLDGVRHCEEAERMVNSPTLFDLFEAQGAAE